MKKLLMLAALLFIVSTALMAQAKQDFTIVNKTGVIIDQVYISQHDVDEWGEDVLGRDALDTDQECDIQFHPKEDACMWDLKIVDQAGTSVEWESLDLCKAVKITLHHDGDKVWADIEE